MATGLEGMVANGWHLFETEDHPFRSALSPFLSKLSESALKELSGNGMSLPPLCAWVLYVAIHTRRKDSPNITKEERLAADAFEQEQAREEAEHDRWPDDCEDAFTFDSIKIASEGCRGPS